MQDFQWLGLTKAEAQALATELNLTCLFIDTQDPKQNIEGMVGKIIGIRQSCQQLHLLVGYFIPGIS
jgi:predicted nucleic acid-binding protein